ncbi:signal transduction histidine kinase [Bacillus mesophilus]|uniref:Signal transduction histidine-protein kinase ArlS n=1 Tax=Bacillus mesophilus TaxID=1808955 RepID=A0A6M0QBA9_9BACI|nr:HAMP domain-containing histidine kinase [Bacillus mesophilus]MBM7663066.1 signal transduction histidine kinase [Bacillus mesophilus]NEY73615.1 HAMP domain-containing histidine kinase [Bacillus mesophilus]
MKRLIHSFQSISLKWRLTLSTSLLMFLTFIIFSFAEYEILYNWLLGQEREAVSKTRDEVAAYYQQINRPFQNTNVRDMENLLLKLNDKHQLIRILDINHNIVISVSNDFPGQLSTAKYPSRDGIEQFQYEGDLYLVAWEHVNSRSFQGTVEVVRNLKSFEDLINIILMIIFGFALATILISIVSGLIISRQYINPIKGLNQAIMRVKEEGFQTRVTETQHDDEFRELTTIFNEMMERVEETFQQQKQFVEDASHELRTPIAVIDGHIALLKRWGKNDPDVLEESLSVCKSEIGRLQKLVLELLELTRSETIENAEITPIPIVEVVEQITKTFAILHPDFTITFNNKTEDKVQTLISKHHLEQIILILLDNAVKYSPYEKRIDVLIQKESDKVFVKIIDQGLGISEVEKNKIFNRFYRVDKARSREQGGVGLGLSIAKRIVEKYKGDIAVNSSENSGSTFIVNFPISK